MFEKKTVFLPNLKKLQFYKDNVRFLNYVVSVQGIRIEDKYIKVVKNWPKLKLVWDIQVFLVFANFYQYFIQDFRKIATLLTLILKMTRLSNRSALILIEANVNKLLEVLVVV